MKSQDDKINYMYSMYIAMIMSVIFHCTGCQKKSRTLDFCYFDIKKYSIFLNFIRKNIAFWKKWYQDYWNWLSSFDYIVISQNIVQGIIFLFKFD